MKTNILILGVFIFFLASYSCKEKKVSDSFTPEEASLQAENVVDPNTAPIMKLSESSHDFGDVKANNKVETFIKFTNTGKSPLVIRDASASCGCTVPEFPTNPIPIGGTDSIKVIYTASNTNGKQKKTVTLITNTVNGHENFDITANIVDATNINQNAKQAFGNSN